MAGGSTFSAAAPVTGIKRLPLAALMPLCQEPDHLPFYNAPGAQLFCGDARLILPTLVGVETIITDPVWPNAHPDLIGHEDPLGLFTETMRRLPASVRRIIVWLGCQSDPRFLLAVPRRFPFLRLAYLRRAIPSYNGRCLVSGDVIYAFGEWPASRPGHRVIPGDGCSMVTNHRLQQPHPAYRNEAAAMWVVKWWGEGIVCDPFAGTGTILVACHAQGVPAIGIEIEAKYCAVAVERLRQLTIW